MTKRRLKLAGVSLIFLFAFLLLIKYKSTVGRWFVIRNSLVLFYNNIVTGVGFGNFDTKYNLYQGSFFNSHEHSSYSNFASYIDTVYNDYLELLVQGGVIMGMILLLYLQSLIKIVSKLRVLNRLVFCSILGIFITLFLALFSFPFRLHSVLTNFILYSCVLISHDKNIIIKFEIKKRITDFCQITILLPALFFLVSLINSNIKYTYLINNENHDIVSTYNDLYPYYNSDKNFLLRYAIDLYKLRMYDKSLIVLLQAQKYSANYDIYLMIGKSYEKLHKPKLAENAYIQAKSMIPKFITAKFELMLLYEQQRDTVNMLKAAKEIIATPQKIKSKRVDEMMKYTNYIMKIQKLK